jgi:SAM-dependent methyltransferase
MPSRIEKEKQFHNVTFSEHTRSATDRFYSIAQSSAKLYHELIIEHGANRRVLEYGCGADSNAIHLARRGARITGIDISEVAIEESKRVAEREGISDAEFFVMNAEELQFEPGTFDLICGSAILHHLVLDRAFAEVARSLKPGGVGVFLEPLGHNPAINLYRRLTPSMRTEDEHPLLMSDLELARDFFGSVDVTFFHLTTLASIPLTRMPFFPRVLGSLDLLDRVLFAAVPFSRRFAWSCVMVLGRPAVRGSRGGK